MITVLVITNAALLMPIVPLAVAAVFLYPAGTVSTTSNVCPYGNAAIFAFCPEVSLMMPFAAVFAAPSTV